MQQNFQAGGFRPQILAFEHVKDKFVVFYFHARTFFLAGTRNPPEGGIWNCDPRTFSSQNAGDVFFPRRVPDHRQIYPVYLPTQMTLATGYLSPHVFVKRTSYFTVARFLGGVEHLYTSEVLKAQQLHKREIRTCELLLKNPHPNVAEYKGVVADTVIRRPGVGVIQTMDKAAVTGLAFKRYEGTLHDLVRSDARFDAAKALADIEAGMRHIHSLGYVHGDLKPENIFYDGDKFVVGDFDSCVKIATPYTLKVGTTGWAHPDPGVYAWPSCDYYGLGQISYWLRKKGFGDPKEGEVYPSTCEILGLGKFVGPADEDE
jgi:serine/threonine protein kinase